LPGFAMFLYGMLQLTLFVEKIIHFIIVKFPQRVTKVVWSDPLIKGIAIGIAILFATFTMINYQGLGEKTYTDDWWLGRLIPDILRVLLGIQRENAASTFEFMVMIAPGINLLQRSVNFANYMSALYRYKLSHPVTEGERVQELIAAGEIFAAYRRCYPKSEEELSTWLFDQNKVNYDEYPVVSNK